MKKIKIASSETKEELQVQAESNDSLIKIHRDPVDGPPRHDLRRLRKDESDPHLKLD